MQILLAEDDKISRELLRRIIDSEAQHEVTLAADGEQAWEFLANPGQKFDVCILDIFMPGISGIDIVGRMRKTDARKNTAIILCTAVHDRETVQRAVQLGVTHYVVKPYSKTLMVEKLRQIKASLGDSGLLEPSAIVCKRLGIDVETHRIMLESLVEDVSEWCQRLRAAADRSVVQKLFIRGRGTKGSCLSLGARSIAEVFNEIESALQTYLADAAAPLPQAAIEPSITNLEQEMVKVGDKIKVLA